MMNSIFYGVGAIILPYKRHKRYTGVTDKKTICKITPFNLGEMKILPRLMDDEKSKKYFVELVDSVTTDTTFENKIPKKTRDFMKYLESLKNNEKPKKYKLDFTFSYLIFKLGDCDLYEIQQNIFNGEESYFNADPEYAFKKACKNLIDGLFYLHSRGICHFDIKPENIVLHETNFKYIDFGFAEEFPFKNYISKGPRGTLEYIPFTTTNPKLLKHFSAFLPYIPCDDWQKCDNTGLWYHTNYQNRVELNCSITTSSIYKADVFALGRTLGKLLDVLCISDYFNCNVINREFINKMTCNKVFLRSSVLDGSIRVPTRILECHRNESDIYCCFSRRGTYSLGRKSKLISLKFT